MLFAGLFLFLLLLRCLFLRQNQEINIAHNVDKFSLGHLQERITRFDRLAVENGAQERLALVEDLEIVRFVNISEDGVVGLAFLDIDSGGEAWILGLATLSIGAHVRVKHRIEGVLVSLRRLIARLLSLNVGNAEQG